MNNLSDVKVGQRVYCLLNGYGTVYDIVEKETYPIKVKFTDLDESYSFEGKLFHYNKNGSLYLDKPEIITPPAPIPTKLIHGVEVPDITFIPSTGEEFYYPDVASYMFVSRGKVDALVLFEHLIKFNMCYPFTKEGREAAILHTKVMLGVSP